MDRAPFSWMSPLGSMAGVMTDRGLAELRFADGVANGSSGGPLAAQIASFVDELARYFAGQRRRFTVALAGGGGGFAGRLLEILCDEVPYGATISYSGLAAMAGRPRASRAVGGALAANPLAIVVPCHRVIRADGRLGGYAGGLDRKRHLLAIEGALPPSSCSLTSPNSYLRP